MNLLPPSIAVIGSELVLAWSDDVEEYLPLRTLREACPCAVCAGEPDVMGQIHSLRKKTFTSESFVVTKYAFVGGYALQFFWGDGHSSGIYSFEYLKNIDPKTINQ